MLQNTVAARGLLLFPSVSVSLFVGLISMLVFMRLTAVLVLQDAACYVCELRGLPGKFDPKRADALDVPRGKVRLEQ